MVEAPLVTAVIPVYNGRAHLQESIDGVLRQQGVSLELIVVDDGSTDGSAELATSLLRSHGHARVLRFANAGVAAARNRGLEQARGRYIAFLDQDDVWYPRKSERQASYLAREQGISVVGCLMDYLGASGRKIGRTSQTPQHIDREQVRSARLVPFPISASMFRTAVLRDRSGSRDYFGPGLATAADLELICLAATAGGVGCLREALGAYRVHRGSVTAQSHELQFTALAYLQEVTADPTFADRTSWPTFAETYRPARPMRRMINSIYHYREAGLNALDRRWLRSAGHLGVALAVSPRYTTTRLARQLRGR